MVEEEEEGIALVPVFGRVLPWLLLLFMLSSIPSGSDFWRTQGEVVLFAAATS